jgi:hypothetical protein
MEKCWCRDESCLSCGQKPTDFDMDIEGDDVRVVWSKMKFCPMHKKMVADGRECKLCWCNRRHSFDNVPQADLVDMRAENAELNDLAISLRKEKAADHRVKKSYKKVNLAKFNTKEEQSNEISKKREGTFYESAPLCTHGFCTRELV